MLRRHGAVLTLLLATCPWAFALNPALDVSQYAHMGWRFRDGFAKSEISAMVQTSDGYLWLGTGSGLFRFDGVKAVPWEPPADQPLPSSFIYSLVAARDGTLWIGTRSGLASWKNGKLTRYAELAGFQIFRLAEDHEGSIWAGAYGVPIGKLCEIRQGSVECPEIGGLGNGVFGLHEDTKGNLWVGLAAGVWRWKPGRPEFYALPVTSGLRGIVDGENGEALVTTAAGIRRLSGDRSPVVFPFPASIQGSARTMLRDRDGGLWVTTTGKGVVHIHHGRTDVFTQADGLTSDVISTFMEDREGSVWVSTNSGLDRFRELPVVSYSTNQGMPLNPSFLLAANDGGIWFNSGYGLGRFDHGQLTIYSRHRRRTSAGVSEITVNGLPERDLRSVFEDSHARIWVSSLAGVGYLENDRYNSTAAPGGSVVGFTEDAAGNLWMAYQDRGLIRLSPRNEIQQIPWDTFGRKDAAQPLADPVQGGLWLAFRNGGVVYFREGHVVASYKTSDGLAEGQINDLRLDGSRALWIASVGGLSRLKNGRFATLTRKNGLPCDEVHWTLEDGDHSVWMGMPCGLVRAERTDLEGALASDKDGRKIQTALFDISDGARTLGRMGGITPHAGKSPDGKLWFLTLDGLSVVDPVHLPFNRLAPPVHIEQVTADFKTHDASSKLRLPALVRDLQIDYTALSLVAPEKNRFKYKLEGYDRDWQDVGNRRQAFYGNLSPRSYRFRVMASNNSGVWNEAGASFDFSIAAAYYQTRWFLAACTAAILALLWALYRFRLHQVAREYNVRVEERLGERTRIARDLHDTLLQSLAGVSLQLDGIAKQAATHPERTPSLIARVREQVDSAFREARTKVWNLRSTSLEAQELDGALRELVERIAPAMTARCSLTVSGHARPCTPEIQEELLRIAQEAANNANRHAQATEVRIALDYGAASLKLSISDNGRGFDFEEGYRKSDHWGLKNMQERAAQIRGKYKITTAVGQGTQIEVDVPLSSWSLRNTLAKHAHSSSGSRRSSHDSGRSDGDH